MCVHILMMDWGAGGNGGQSLGQWGSKESILKSYDQGGKLKLTYNRTILYYLQRLLCVLVDPEREAQKLNMAALSAGLAVVSQKMVGVTSGQ